MTLPWQWEDEDSEDLAAIRARAWADARVQRIYGGTTEIMKEIVARHLLDAPARHQGRATSIC